QSEVSQPEIKSKSDYFLEDINLIPTTDIIKNIKVVYEEVKANIKEEEDFIIKPVTKVSNKIKEIEVEEEQQITLTFDLPLSNTTTKANEAEHKLSYEDHEEVKKIQVNDYVELITVTESNETGDIRYTLEDYIEVESSMNKKQETLKDIAEEEDYNVVFEKKIIVEDITEDAV